ncbi:ATP-dependent nuclease [Hephaestia mangrovi]|uniref:ATP-dependent nuclease n=1 Tax=Hephaestia mangrovi TaxID=2873268 RepID=UPI001CA67D9E|nr:ATP-binding protein [Hephaestia mangrovi]MBY8826813.1 ATP-binding protein [Hephaestia mangrovi]
MLRALLLQNFRGFADHRIEFGGETILIGQNNAGKTTTIEALRVISVCQMRALTTGFSPCPPWLDQHCQGAGFKPSLETIDFDFANVQHGYDSDSPAILVAKLSNNSELHIFIGKETDQVFCQLRVGSRKIIHSRSELGKRSFGNIKVMPPIGSLLPHEKVISKERLRRYMDGYLAYRHFRNQLWEMPSAYRIFKSLLEETWHGLKIEHFENDHGIDQNEFSLLVREHRFPAEISWHGHGLQAWMQTIWFLSRVNKDATVVLDEPDVYLHADLQRKLIKVIENLNFKQAIIATHSSEIIGDVPFESVIVIKKQEKTSRPARNAEEIQRSLENMGSIHSIQLSKLAQRGLLLFVEGDDKSFLTDVAYKLGSRVFDNFAAIAIQEIKGKGNWQHAIGVAKALDEASGGSVQTALLLDSDFMLSEQRDEYLNKAISANLLLKIWKKKEIENYFIQPKIITRYINRQNDNDDVSDDQIIDIISEIERDLKTDVILSYSDVVQKASAKRIEPKTAYRRAEEIVNRKIDSGFEIKDLASGKAFIGRISDKTHKRFGVSITAQGLCKEMRSSEIPPEMKALVEILSTSVKIDFQTFQEAPRETKDAA